MNRPGRRARDSRPGGRRSGSRAGAGARRPLPRRDPEAFERLLLEACDRMDAGRIRDALAAAGEAVRADRTRPEGFQLIGEINLEAGQHAEARVAFSRAAERARHLKDDVEGHDLCLDAESGRARTELAAGNASEARAILEGVLQSEGSDLPELLEWLAVARLQDDDPAAAIESLEAGASEGPAAQLCRSVALLAVGSEPEGVVALRRALLLNFYLVAALVGEDPPDLGLEHGIEESTPEAAREAVARLGPFLDRHPAIVRLLIDVATTPMVGAEVEEALDLARALNAEPLPSVRSAHSCRLAELRDTRRLRDSVGLVLSELPPPDEAGFDV